MTTPLGQYSASIDWVLRAAAQVHFSPWRPFFAGSSHLAPEKPLTSGQSVVMSERSCPISGSARGRCPASGAPYHSQSRPNSRLGPRGCSFSGYCQPGDVHAAFDVCCPESLVFSLLTDVQIPKGVDAEEWLRMR